MCRHPAAGGTYEVACYVELSPRHRACTARTCTARTCTARICTAHNALVWYIIVVEKNTASGKKSKHPVTCEK